MAADTLIEFAIAVEAADPINLPSLLGEAWDWLAVLGWADAYCSARFMRCIKSGGVRERGHDVVRCEFPVSVAATAATAQTNYPYSNARQ